MSKNEFQGALIWDITLGIIFWFGCVRCWRVCLPAASSQLHRSQPILPGGWVNLQPPPASHRRWIRRSRNSSSQGATTRVAIGWNSLRLARMWPWTARPHPGSTGPRSAVRHPGGALEPWSPESRRFSLHVNKQANTNVNYLIDNYNYYYYGINVAWVL